MKALRALIAIVLLTLAFSIPVSAQTFQIANMIVTTPCTSVPITGVSANLICIDSASGLLYYPGASGMTAINMSASTGVVLTGKTSGAVTLQSNTGTYNYNFPTTAGAIGALLSSGGGGAAANVNIWLPDVASGQVLTSAGATTIPAFTASPAVTSATFTGTGLNILDATNGGHIDSLKGTAALPSPGTGTVTAGGTDNAFLLTGATSPVTVTFATAFTNAPVCVCSDVTSALGACKAVGSTGTVIVTTTGTDSVNVICIGK